MPEKSTDLALDASLEAELTALRSELFEAELASLRSRAADLRSKLSTDHLTQIHKNQIQDALRGLQLRRSVVISASSGNGKAEEYAQGFTEVFTALGWEVEQFPANDTLPSKGNCRASGFRTEDREPDRVFLRYAEAAATQSIAEGSRFANGSHLRSGSLRLAVVSRPGDTTAAVLGSALRRLGIPVARFEDPSCAEHHLELLIGKQPAASQTRPSAG